MISLRLSVRRWMSFPNPMRVCGIKDSGTAIGAAETRLRESFVCELRAGFLVAKFGTLLDVLALLGDEETCQRQVRGLGDLDVPVRAHQHFDLVAVVLDQTGLIGAGISFRNSA